MTLKIFVDKKHFDSLKRSIPAVSIFRPLLKGAVFLANAVESHRSATAVITCTVIEARELLIYARRSCLGAAACIAEAIRDAGLIP